MFFPSRKAQLLGLALLVGLALLAFSLRVGFCVWRGSLGTSPPVTYREYVIVGQNLLTQGTLTTPLVHDGGSVAPGFVMPPAYAALVAGTYALLGVESTASTLFLQLLNALATTLTVLIVHDLARKLGGARAGVIAALLVAIHPALFAYTDAIWDTSLFTLAVAASVWTSYRLGERGQKSASYFLLGLWLGAVALLNPALTITYPILVLWPAHRGGLKSIRGVIRPVGWAMFGWAIALAPWTARNYLQFDRLIYVRGGFWIEMWLGSCPEADNEGAEVYKRQYPLSNPQLERQVLATGEQAWVAECERRAKAAIASDPKRWCKLIAQRAADYWIGTAFGHRVQGGSFLPQSTDRRLMMLLYLVELTLIIGLSCGRRRERSGGIVVLASLLLSFSIVYCLTHVQVRYRAPMEPIAAVLLGMLGARTTGKRAEGTPRSTSLDM